MKVFALLPLLLLAIAVNAADASSVSPHRQPVTKDFNSALFGTFGPLVLDANGLHPLFFGNLSSGLDSPTIGLRQQNSNTAAQNSLLNWPLNGSSNSGAVIGMRPGIPQNWNSSLADVGSTYVPNSNLTGNINTGIPANWNSTLAQVGSTYVPNSSMVNNNNAGLMNFQSWNAPSTSANANCASWPLNQLNQSYTPKGAPAVSAQMRPGVNHAAGQSISSAATHSAAAQHPAAGAPPPRK